MFAKDYAQYYDLINSDKPYKQEIEFIYDWAEKPSSILDLGCGTANYWKHFPPTLKKIMGLEKSQAMIRLTNPRNFVFTHDIENDGFSGSCFDTYFDCVLAMFDVINYLPSQRWWPYLPIKKRGYFIFDIWDIEKVNRDGFENRVKEIDGFKRAINLKERIGDKVILSIHCEDKFQQFNEEHTLYLYSEADIKNFCGRKFKIVGKKVTDTWQTWYKLQRL